MRPDLFQQLLGPAFSHLLHLRSFFRGEIRPGFNNAFQSPGRVENIMEEQPLQDSAPLLIGGVPGGENRESALMDEWSRPHSQIQGYRTLGRGTRDSALLHL